MSESMHVLESSPERSIIFANMFKDITNWERQKRCQTSVKRLMWWLFSHKIHSWLFVVVLQERKGQGNQMKKDHLTSFADCEWDKIAFRVRSGFIYINALSVHVFEHAASRSINEAKERRRSSNPFKKRFRQSSQAREIDFGVQPTVYRREKLDPQHDASSD